MFKDEKIERKKPSNRILVTVNKSKNREEIRRHLFFVYSIVYPLTRRSLHHVHPEGKGRGAHSTQPAKTSVFPPSSSLGTFRAEEKRMFSQATPNNVFAGRLRSAVQPLTLLNTILEERFPYHFQIIPKPVSVFCWLDLLTSARSAWRASVSRSRLVASVGHFIYSLPTSLPFHVTET